LGVRVIDPRTTVVSLLDQFVRSPAATSLLLGMVEDEEVRDIIVVDPNLDDKPLRDLQLPQDVLVLSIQRGGEYLITHGYTTLKRGDKVSILGTPESLDIVSLRFEM
jgi:Trk K+ transport system NAD-binding subunit